MTGKGDNPKYKKMNVISCNINMEFLNGSFLILICIEPCRYWIYIYPSIHCHNLHIRTVEYCCSSPVDATNFKPQEQLQEQLLNRVHGNTKISLIVLFMIVCFVPSITSSVSMMIQKIGAFAPLDINIIYI